MRQNTQEYTNKNFGGLPLKNLKGHKGCHPQILLGPFLNTLSHI